MHGWCKKTGSSICRSEYRYRPKSAGNGPQAAPESLSNLSGTEFDRAYMDHNVVVHERDFRLFREQALSGIEQASPETEAGIRIFATNTSPAIQRYLLAAKGISAALDPAVFLMNTFQNGLAEILLSTLALEKATDPGVIAFAQTMTDDHTQANSEIVQLAQAETISLGQSADHAIPVSAAQIK
jgi:predicted outer membrane protein